VNIDVVDNLSSVTNIPRVTIESLKNKETLCVAHAVATMSNDDVLVADIGIGNLCIGMTDCGVRYKFIPNKMMEEKITSAFDGFDPLSKALEDSLSSKIISTYKNIL
jgi:hypothetical protein